MASGVASVEGMTVELGGGSDRGEGVEYFTPSERAASGKAARAEVRRRAHGFWEPSPLRRSPVELLEDQAQDTVAGARADPVRTDARLAVRVLPGRAPI